MVLLHGKKKTVQTFLTWLKVEYRLTQEFLSSGKRVSQLKEEKMKCVLCNALFWCYHGILSYSPMVEVVQV